MGIGVLNEKGVHRQLKAYFAHENASFEVPLFGSIIDVVNESGNHRELLEIQTGSLAPLTEKLHRLSAAVKTADDGFDYHITLIHPMFTELILCVKDEAERPVSRRRSPLHEDRLSVFEELCHTPSLLTVDNLSFNFVYVKAEETRYPDRIRRGRLHYRKGERFVTDIINEETFPNGAALLSYLPAEPGESFTAADIAERLNVRRDRIYPMLYTFNKAGLILPAGKRGRQNLYTYPVK